jgi:alkylhydroperoxidase family enzyme
MLRFSLHTLESAPPAAQELLRRVQNGFGFLPTLFAKLAESATALAAYLDLRSHFERSSLSPVEQQVVALATCVENESTFCTSAHSFAARQVAGMPQQDIDALREGGELPDPKLNVLADFTREVVRQRGQVDDGDINVFLAAGYSREQMLDVVMGVALKTFTNYASHIVRPPLNAEFAAEQWTPPGGEPEPISDPDEEQTLRNRRWHH